MGTNSPLPNVSRPSRRAILATAAAVPAAALLIPAEAQSVETQASRRGLDATAGNWLTWNIPSPLAARVPAPAPLDSASMRRETKELLRLQDQRGKAQQDIVNFWDAQGGVTAWTSILLNVIKSTATNPVLGSRAMAHVQTAMADAAISAWFWKFRFRRRSPSQADLRIHPTSDVDPLLPSYVSEHAAIAAAAAMVLNFLYPATLYNLNGQLLTFDGIAQQSALSRLWAGANYRSDIERGWLVGQYCAAAAISRAATDGSANTNPVTAPVGPDIWTSIANPPTAGLLPRAGQWRTWLLERGDQFRAPAPNAYVNDAFTPEFLAQVQEVHTTVANLTDDQKAIANFWADNPGVSFTPPGHWLDISRAAVLASDRTAVRAARTLALVAAGLADAAISCWDSKYTYWLLRPVNAIRTIAGQAFSDPAWASFIPTPNFPSYTSGHSTFSGCASTILQSIFPNGTTADALGVDTSYTECAAQAALSRLYGGIHYSIDNNEGLAAGQKIGALGLKRLRRDR